MSLRAPQTLALILALAAPQAALAGKPKAKPAAKTKAKPAAKTKATVKAAVPAPRPLVDGKRAVPRTSDPALAALVEVGEAAWQEQRAIRKQRKRTPVTWVRARRRTRLPENVSHGVALRWDGKPVKSRRAIQIREQKVDAGETMRSVAYEACTSPQLLASVNGLAWDPAGTPLPEGVKLKVPLRFRAASGFARAVRLRTGPGVMAKRVHNTWGRPYVVKLLTQAFRAVHRRWPGRHPFIVHDVSLFGGGRLGRHKSHRAGRDIDIGYPTFAAVRKDWGRPALSAIDYGRLWSFIDHLERTGYLAAVYMSPRIQRRLYNHAVSEGADKARLQTLFQYPCARGQKKTLIRHSPGHRDHMHLRFAAPADLPDLQS